MMLGPALLGAVIAGAAVAKARDDRGSERLDAAAVAVRASLHAICGKLAAVAEAVAGAPDAQRPGLAARFIAQGLAQAVRIDRGLEGLTSGVPPPPPWADCSGASLGPEPGTDSGYRAISARAFTPEGVRVGAAFAADGELLRRLSEASGAEVTLLAGSGRPEPTDGAPAGLRPAALGQGPGLRRLVPPVQSTLDDAMEVVLAAASLGDGAGRTASGDPVRRIGPGAGEPLPMVISLDAAAAPGTRLVVVWGVLLAVTAAATMAWWLAGIAIRPLGGLAAAAARVAGGDLRTLVPANGADEVARLGAAFNHMARDLGTYRSALAASRRQLREHLGTLGETLGGAHDAERISQLILRAGREASGAAAGVVMIADSDGELVGSCVEGLDVEARRIRVAVGEGLCGAVAQTGVPRRGRIDSDGPRPAPGEPPCRTYLVVPLGRGPGRGVLALYDRLGGAAACDEFDDEDLVALRTFAAQAAVALENVGVQRFSRADPLPGPSARRRLREALRLESRRAELFGHELALLAIAVDARAHGDALLAEVAQRIRDELRDVDSAFQVDGAEFAVLLPETGQAGGVATAQRLSAAVRDTPVAAGDGEKFMLTISTGIAVFPDHANLVGAADEALWHAQAAGGDTFRVAGTPIVA
jgi:diguanylate cyclase (GGDEF)-like protein